MDILHKSFLSILTLFSAIGPKKIAIAQDNNDLEDEESTSSIGQNSSDDEKGNFEEILVFPTIEAGYGIGKSMFIPNLQDKFSDSFYRTRFTLAIPVIFLDSINAKMWISAFFDYPTRKKIAAGQSSFRYELESGLKAFYEFPELGPISAQINAGTQIRVGKMFYTTSDVKQVDHSFQAHLQLKTKTLKIYDQREPYFGIGVIRKGLFGQYTFKDNHGLLQNSLKKLNTSGKYSSSSLLVTFGLDKLTESDDVYFKLFLTYERESRLFEKWLETKKASEDVKLDADIVTTGFQISF